MADKDSHPIRNGIIATVVGGILLSFWTPFRDLVAKVFLWVWGLLVSAWNYLWETHEIYGWLIIVFTLLSIPTVIRIAISLFKKKDPTHLDLYKEDHLFGALWHWDYSNGEIVNLWCLCPICKSELVYSEYNPHPFLIDDRNKTPKTEFICEKCRVTRASFEGKQSYALGTVEREIRRKIRTNEWRENVE